MKRFSLALIILACSLSSFAKEGMWIPSLIKNLVESDMQSMGMKLSAEDLYSFNKSSLKDAIVHFNGGCTAEMISDEGLLLTNHHCGYSLIQS
ncbi:S46 family peptidase, partial [Salibacteraceae bacterium]|nr:S46 family peptidase [Salibacteraceae bacterium]